jgi:putative Ca2+/H+ antiporter (TMEM165/GDT1 family)
MRASNKAEAWEHIKLHLAQIWPPVRPDNHPCVAIVKFCIRVAVAALGFCVAGPQLAFAQSATSSCIADSQGHRVRSAILQSWNNGLSKLQQQPDGAFNLGFDVHQTSDPSFVLTATVTQPSGVDDNKWNGAYYVVVLNTRADSGGPIKDTNLILTNTSRLPVSANKHELTIRADKQPSGIFRQSWDVLILACIGDQGQFDAFGSRTTSVLGVELGILVGLLSAAAIAIILALAAAYTSRRQLLRLYRRYRRTGYQRKPARALLFARCLSPAFVSQDTFGFASLGRFQVLLFTTAIIGVYAYVYALTATLPTMSNSVLALLGISLSGSALARFTEAPILTTPNRIWLLSTGAVERGPRLPRWQDFLTGEGEVDVTRVQALAFSIVAAIALVVNGASDLANFAIPEQVNYLLGVSQTIYVAGKAVTKESVKRLNEEIQALRTAESTYLSEASRETAVAARSAFSAAKTALSATLGDVFGERFNARAFDQFEPGRRVS